MTKFSSDYIILVTTSQKEVFLKKQPHNDRNIRLQVYLILQDMENKFACCFVWVAHIEGGMWAEDV